MAGGGPVVSPMTPTLAHLDALVATGGEGFLGLSAAMGARWHSVSFPTDQVDQAEAWTTEANARGWNMYVRTNLLRDPITDPHKRGGAVETGCAVAFAVDLDVAGPGHAAAARGLPLPPSRAHAMAIVEALPEPSLTVNTGGGFHLWWLLAKPVSSDPVALHEGWADRIVEAGRVRGWHVDRPDAARVLRLCGTTRRKPGVEPNPVSLEAVAGRHPGLLERRPWCPAGLYDPGQLLAALPQPAEPEPRAIATESTVWPDEVGPADAVALMEWSLIMGRAGWTYVGMGTVHGGPVELWLRPGEPSSRYSVKCSPDGWAVAWSDACGLPPGRGQRLTKWRVYVWLHHGGDEAAAAACIRAAANGLVL